MRESREGGFEFVRNIVKASVVTVIEHLRKLPGYECNQWKLAL